MRALLLAAALLTACKPSAPRAAASAPALASDDAEDRLIAANVSRPADAELAAQYADLNERYFSKKLPAVPVRWEPGLSGVKIAAAPALTIEGLWGRGATGGPAILLNPDLKGDAAKLTATLCHEMSHEYLDTQGRGGGRHGPEFQAQLKRLYDAGAFQGLPPGEGEKQGLREWLVRQRGELDAQNKELAARRAALGPRPTPEAVAEFNGLVSRQNIMAGDYNREAQRFNEMNAYPDGLDEDQAVAAAAGAGAAAASPAR